jgi:hypothetical protein
MIHDKNVETEEAARERRGAPEACRIARRERQCVRQTSDHEPVRNYLKTLNVIARSAATRQSESLAWEIASLRSQ